MTTKIGVAIVGASGYAARELIEILLGHPHVRITAATSRRTRRRGWMRCIPAWRGGSTSPARSSTPTGSPSERRSLFWHCPIPRAWRSCPPCASAACA